MLTKRKPSYLLHKTSGQARVRIDGKDHYLGPHNSPESIDRYNELVDEWLARQGDVSAFTLTVDHLALLYLKYADGYYLKDGKPTGEADTIRLALRPLLELYGISRAREFGPRKLKDVREAMIKAGWVRTSINAHVGRIRRMFKWAVAEELLPVDVYTTLSTVSGLRSGRSRAKESKPVKPVPEAFFDAVRPHVSRQVWGMIQLQLLTGMRPGEVVLMRGCDLDITGKVWEYVPQSHKTQHHGKQRMVFIGEKAQEILWPFLKNDVQSYLFSPIDARREFNEELRKNRKTKVFPCEQKRKPKINPKRKPGEHYTTVTYGGAIKRACKAAGIPAWAPNRLRHNAATNIRREFGIEAARTVLGHSSAVTSEIYAEMDFDSARAIMAKIG